MSNAKFKINRSGVKELMRSEPMKAICEEYGNQIAARAKGDYKVEASIGSTRARATVSADSVDTYYDNLENNILIKAVK